jgi:hypothetical protein
MGQGTHQVALFEIATIKITADDLACYLQAGQVRGIGWRRIGTGALQNVGAIHSCRMHANQHFASAGHGHGSLTRP